MPTICFVQHRPASRVPRLMRAMHLRGWKVRALTRNPLWRHAPLCEAVESWGTVRELVAAFDAAEGVDVWHVAQDPAHDWLAPLLVSRRNLLERWRERVVWDLRDLGSLAVRQLWVEGAGSPIGRYASVWETWGLPRVDGLVQVSEACAFQVQSLYRETKHTPTALVRSFVGEDQLCDWPDPDTRAGLVYSGGLAAPDSHAVRNYSPDLRAFRASGLPVAVQAGDNGPLYEPLGIEAVPYVSQRELVSSLTRFRWGLVGFPLHYALGMCAFPNKLGEYLAAGVVPVVLRASEARRFVEEHGVGVGGDSPEEVLPLLTPETWARCHANILRHHARWTMEQEAGVYERMLCEVRRKPVRWRDPTLPSEWIWDVMLSAVEGRNVLVDPSEFLRRTAV